MEIIELPGGFELTLEDRAVIVELNQSAKVMSTSFLNGGFRDDLLYLFNYCEIFGRSDGRCVMRASTNEEHLRAIATELGLDPRTTAGLSTSARVKESTIKTAEYADFSVAAVITAGIDISGSRAGDPAFWHEKNGVPFSEKAGTINIMLFIDADLTAGALCRAMVTCTEAKTAALQEMLAPSCSSNGLATGSGTDGTIIVANGSAPTRLTNAGHHSKMGEYIGRVVKEGLKEGLVVEEGFEAYSCGSILKRIGRFGLDEEKLWQRFLHLSEPGENSRELFNRKIARINKDEQVIARATLYAHLLDLLQWNLIKPDVAVKMASELLAKADGPEAIIVPQGRVVWASNQEVLEYLVRCFNQYLVSIVVNEGD